MSYIADQLKRIGLVINYVKKTPENEYPYKVSVRFSHVNGSTNEIGITNSQLTKIYRILSKEDNDPIAYEPFKLGRRLDSNRRQSLRRNPAKGPSDYYYKLLRAKVPMDSHESDLYVKDTPTARAILADWPFGRLGRFKNNINGEIYIDIPFAYAPYWEKKVRR